MRVCAFTAVCSEDLVWVNQYLEEAERLKMPFVLLSDRCTKRETRRLRWHPLCHGCMARPVGSPEFDESCKQPLMDLLAAVQAEWAMAWDIDETYATDAPHILPSLLTMDTEIIDVKWVNLWDSPEYIRIDGPFQGGHRSKFLNLRSGVWRFTHKIINGPKLFDAVKRDTLKAARLEKRHDFVCLHFGMMTLELRLLHKQRWDRIYTVAVGEQPYGFWNYSLDPAYPPLLKKHDYITVSP